VCGPSRPRRAGAAKVTARTEVLDCPSNLQRASSVGSFALDHRHHVGVPDNLDYAAFAQLLEGPTAWSRQDFTTARAALAHQWRALQESNPRDTNTYASLQEVVEQLEAAIDAYVRSR
jgi:hypothetical protein